MKLKKLLSVSLSLLLTFSLAFSILPTTAMAEGEEEDDTYESLLLDDMNPTSEWTGGTVAYDAALKTNAITGTAGNEASTGSKLYYFQLTLPEEEKIDATKYGYVEFDLYVEDPTKVQTNSAWNGASLSSDGTADHGIGVQWETEANFPKASQMISGWNHVVLRYDEYLVDGFDPANKSDNQPAPLTTLPDWKAVNYFRLYIRTTEETTVKLANVVLTNGPRSLQAEDGQMILDCDDLTGWNVHELTRMGVDPANKTQGVGSLSASGYIMFEKTFDPVDISAYKYLALDLYVADPSTFKIDNVKRLDSRIELSSGGDCNNNCYRFPITSYDLVQGWNHLVFSIDDMHTYDKDYGEDPTDPAGVPDPKAINYFRMFSYPLTNEDVVKIDNIRAIGLRNPDEGDVLVINAAETEADAAEFTDGFILHPDWAAPNATITSTVGTGGAKTIPSHFNAFEWNVTSQNTNTTPRTIDLTKYDNIEFDIYIDPNLLSAFRKGGSHHHAISLASSTTGGGSVWNAHQEWAGDWQDRNLNLQAGWNHVILPLDDLALTEEDNSHTLTFDLSKVDYIRYYMESNALPAATGTICVDNLVATKNPVTTAEDDTYKRLDLGNMNNTWSGGTIADDEELNGKAIGVTQTAAGQAEFHLVLSEGVDASKYGYVEFDLYVQDAAKIKKDAVYGVSLTSDNGAFKNEGVQWQAASFNHVNYLSNGWNHIVLPYTEYLKAGFHPLAKSAKQPDFLYDPILLPPNYTEIYYKPAVWTEMDSFRLYINSSEPTTFKVANVMLSTGPRETVEENSKMIIDCDDPSDLEGGYVDPMNKTQGYSSISSVGPLFVIQNVLSNPVDISAYDFFALDVYVEDPNVFKDALGAGLEIGSGGEHQDTQWANECYQFDIKSVSLVKGWNRLVFPLDGENYFKDVDSSKGWNGGKPQNNKINWFRLYAVNNDDYPDAHGTGLVKIDNIRALNAPSNRVLDDGTLVIANAESPVDATYFSDGFTASPNFAAPDTGSTAGLGGTKTIVQNVTGEYPRADFNVFEWNITSHYNPGANREPIDLRGYDNIEFDLYIDEALLPAFAKGEHHHVITLASSANDPTVDDPATEIDDKKYMWGAHQEWTGAWLDANLTLKSGWNHIVLPLDALGVTDAAELSALDLSKVDYIRYYINAIGYQDTTGIIAIDNLVATKKSNSPDTGDTVPVAPIALTVLGLVATVATVKVSSKKKAGNN